MATTLTNPSTQSGISCTLATGAAPAPVTSNISLSPTENLSVGFSIGCVQKCFAPPGPVSITNGSPYTVNLLTGNDPLGNALSMATLTHINVYNQSTTANQKLTVGGGTHPVCGSDQFTVGANGGEILIQNPGDGYAVVVSTTDTLQVACSTGTTTFEIVLLGR